MAKKIIRKQAMSDDERNALQQIAKLDKRIVDDRTVVRLDRTTRSKDGAVMKKYIIAQGDRVKYEAKFRQEDRRQKLVQVASVKRVERIPEK